MPEARLFKVKPVFGGNIGTATGGACLTRINVTSAQAANYVNILSLEDAAKLYWNLQAISGDVGYSSIQDECNPIFSAAPVEIASGATLQPDERICSSPAVNNTEIDPEVTDNVQTFGRTSINLTPREVYNTDTNEVIGYTLPSSSFSLGVFGLPLSGGTLNAVLIAGGGNIVLNHILGAVTLVGTFDPTVYTNIDEVSGDQRTYRNVSMRQVSFAGIGLTAVIIREGFIDTEIQDDLLLDDDPCADVEDSLTIVFETKSWTVGFSNLNAFPSLQDILDTSEFWTYP